MCSKCGFPLDNHCLRCYAYITCPRKAGECACHKVGPAPLPPEALGARETWEDE